MKISIDDFLKNKFSELEAKSNGEFLVSRFQKDKDFFLVQKDNGIAIEYDDLLLCSFPSFVENEIRAIFQEAILLEHNK